MKGKSKRIRTTRTSITEPRPSEVLNVPSSGRLTRRGSTSVTDERPYRRGSSDAANESS